MKPCLIKQNERMEEGPEVSRVNSLCVGTSGPLPSLGIPHKQIGSGHKTRHSFWGVEKLLHAVWARVSPGVFFSLRASAGQIVV